MTPLSSPSLLLAAAPVDRRAAVLGLFLTMVVLIAAVWAMRRVRRLLE